MPSDVVLIGAGIMSATLGALLRELDPSLEIQIFERLESAAAESSDAWNNAGTGHSGYCELNYTPEVGGEVDVGKAVRIADQFAQSLELWRALVRSGALPAEDTFLRAVPHVSFVWGDDDVRFLEERHRKLVAHRRFAPMELARDPAQIAEWIPLVMEGEPRAVPVAATRMAEGYDVNFGALTRSLVANLEQQGVGVHLGHEVVDLRREDGLWAIDVQRNDGSDPRTLHARFVFIGAGGYSLKLLEMSGISEAAGFGAFPVSGQWLRCTNREVIERHHAKVYGKAESGAPPMSVPHLDSRWIADAAHEGQSAGRKELLFGPYAGVTTRFLKGGSIFDLLGSIGIHNLLPVMRAGIENHELTEYLLGQAMLTEEERLALLRRYCPLARAEDWEVQVAGLRVQIIKADAHGRGELKFGTEVVTSADGSIAALLGASPGASTAVSIMLEVIARCFPARRSTFEPKLCALLPSLTGA